MSNAAAQLRPSRAIAVPPPSAAVSTRRLAVVGRRALVIGLQIGVLTLVNAAGYALAQRLRLALPGNLVGMLVLLALLWTGVVRLEWIQSGATLLTRHLAFFFIPITVGLMAFAHLFVERGVAIVVTLALSAGIGMALAGHAAQALAGRKDRR